MNVEKITAELSNLKDKDILLKKFKTRVCNAHVLYLNEATEDLSFHEAYDYEETQYEFKEGHFYVNAITARELLSDIGLIIDEEKICRSYFSEQFEHWWIYPYLELWESAKSLSDLEFFIAILSLTINIEDHSELGKFYKGTILPLLEESGFGQIYEQARPVKADTVFIAMWFDKRMDEAQKKIKKAVIDCGYIPVVIDQKEHNNQIVPEIFQEIKESIFVVADFTGKRGGVYYEAGYAQACGKKVIHTCEKGKKLHFDVAQINTIFWKDPNDLYERLVKRIKATIL